MPYGPSIHLDDATRLVPVFDPVLRNYCVQLWMDGRPGGIHGLIENFRDADEAVDTLHTFLEAEDVRQLTDKELSDVRTALHNAGQG